MNEKYIALAERHNVSVEAVVVLAEALKRGNGRAAQFNHPDLGGSGQWMPGMVMVGDMFNDALKAKVAALCQSLVDEKHYTTVTGTTASWWPESLGQPSASGAQNDTRYAIFPQKRRLLVRRGDKLTVYDTGDLQITGVAQQQAGAAGQLHFATRQGTVQEHDLDIVDP